MTIVLFDEIGQLDIVPAGRAGAEPLRVADDQVVCVAMGVKLGECLGLEVRPGVVSTITLTPVSALYSLTSS